MPTLDDLRKQYELGQLSTYKMDAYDSLVERGEAEKPITLDLQPKRRSIVEYTVNADTELVGDVRAGSIASAWLKAHGYSDNGAGFFSAEGVLNGTEQLKRIQNLYNPGKHSDVMSDLEKFNQLDRDGKLKEADTWEQTFTPTGVTGVLDTFQEVASEYLAYGKFSPRFVKEREDARIRRTEQQLAQKDFMFMKSMYDENVKSEASLQFVEAAANGIVDQAFFDGLPEDEKPFIPGYVRLMKATADQGTAYEFSAAILGGVWDIGKGAFQYPLEKGVDAVLSAGELLGSRQWGEHLDYVRKVRSDVRTEQEMLATKFEERNFAQKGVVGLGHSLPLMASFFTPMPGTGAIGTIGKLTKFQQLVKSLPVAMATVTMAREFEGRMIDDGIDPEYAGAVALPVSILNMYVEKASLDRLFNIGGNVLSGVTTSLISKRILGAAKGGIQAILFESAEEIVQAYNEELFTQIGKQDLSMDELNATVSETVAEIAPTMAMFAGFGVAMGGLRTNSIENYLDASKANESYQAKLDTLMVGATEVERKQAFESIFSLWLDAPVDERKDVLRNAPTTITNIEEAHELFNDMEKRVVEAEELLKQDENLELVEDKVRTEMVDALKTEATRLGLPFMFVEALSGDAEIGSVGQVTQSGIVEILTTAKDPARVLTHESVHVAVDAGIITENEWNVLKDSVTEKEMDDVISDYIVELEKGTLGTDGLIEEIIAEKKANLSEMPAEAKTILRKIADFFLKLKNLVKHKSFTTAEDIFGKIDSRLAETATARTADFQARQEEDAYREQAVLDAQEFADELVKRNVEEESMRAEEDVAADKLYKAQRKFIPDTEKRMEVFYKFADANGSLEDPRFAQVNPYELGDVEDAILADNLGELDKALKALEKQMRKWKRLAEKTKDVRSGKFAKEKPSTTSGVAQLIARTIQRNPSVEQSVLREMINRYAPDGDPEIILNEATEILRQAQQSFNKKLADITTSDIRQASIRNKYRGVAERIRSQGFVEGTLGERVSTRLRLKDAKAKRRKIKQFSSKSIPDDKLTVTSLVADDFVDTLRGDVDRIAKEKGITSEAAKGALFNRTAARLMDKAIRQLRFNKTRSVLNTLRNKLLNDNVKPKTADKIVRDIQSRLRNVSDAVSGGNALKEIGKLLGSVTKGRARIKQELTDRKIPPHVEAELRMAKAAYKLSQNRVDAIVLAIDSVLESGIGGNFEGIQTRVNEVNELFPSFRANGKLQNLSDMERLRVARDVLTTWGALSSKSGAEIAEALVALETTIVEGVRNAQQAALEKVQEYVDTTKNFMGATKSTSGKRTKSKGTLAGMFWNIEQRFEELSRFGGKVAKKAMDRVISSFKFQESSDEFDKLRYEWLHTIIRPTILDNYGVKSFDRIASKLNEEVRKFAKYDMTFHEPMSRAQLMQLISTWEQDDYKSNMEKMGYTEKMVDDMRNDLDPRDLKLIEELRGVYREWGELLDEKSMEVFGVPIANKSPNYMPVVVDVEKLWNATEIHVAPLLPPAYNERVLNDSQIDTRASILGVLDSKLRQNAHWLSHVDSATLAANVLSYRKLAKQLGSVHGNDWRATQEHMHDIYGDSRIDPISSPTLKWLASTYTLRSLSFHPKLPFTQFTSFPAFAFKTGLFNWAKDVAYATTHPQEYAEAFIDIWNSPQRKSRTSFGTDEFVEMAMRERFGDSILDNIPEGSARDVIKELGRLIRQGTQMGMWSTKGGDILPILLFGPATYMSELKKADGDKEKAMSRTWQSIHSTQQSFATKDRNALSRRAGTIGRFFNMFMTVPGQYLGYTTLAMKQLAADPSKENATKVMNALFISHVLLAGMYFTVSAVYNNLLGDDEWDEDDMAGLMVSMAVGANHAWPVLGALGEASIEAAISGKVRYRGGAILPIGGMVGESVLMGKLVRHGLTLKWEEALDDFIKLAEKSSAVGRTVKKIKNR